MQHQSEGLPAQQYELRLAVSGLPPDKVPTIKELASQLRLNTTRWWNWRIVSKNAAY